MTAEYLAVHDFFHACLTERSIQHTLDMTDPSLLVFGTGKDTALLDRDEFIHMLEKEFSIQPDPIEFHMHHWKQQAIAPSVWNCCFLMDILHTPQKDRQAIFTMPVSGILRLQEQRYTICSLHTSIPSDALPSICIPEQYLIKSKFISLMAKCVCAFQMINKL